MNAIQETEEIDITVETPTRGDCRALRLEREKRAVRKQLLAARLAEMVCIRRLSFKECAAELGISYRYVLNLWGEVKQSGGIADHLSHEEKERVAEFVADTLQHVTRTAAERMGDHAAYGMVALNGCKQLAEIHGIDFRAREDGGGVLATLEEVAASVLEHAPLLAGQLDKIRRIKALQAESGILAAAR